MRLNHPAPCHCGDCRDRRHESEDGMRSMFKEALATQLLCASDSNGQVRFLRSCSRLEAMAGLLPDSDIDPSLIGLQYPSRDGHALRIVTLRDMEDARPMGDGGWLLPDGTEIWFRRPQ